jgi:hypothetical protein
MKTLKQEWLDRAKETGIKDPDPNNRMCQAFAHFDGEGWTKFNMAALIIDLSEQLDKLEGDNDFYKEWNAKKESDEEIEEEARLKDGDDELSWSK